MEIHPQVIIFVGSLAAIFALAAVAWWLRLGGDPKLDSDDAVRRAANEIADGYDPVAITRDSTGMAALARDASGQVMLIKRHGNRFAGRILGIGARANRLTGTALRVDCGEARFGTVTLDIADAHAWADAINALNERRDA